MIIGLGSSPDQTRQINRLLTGRSFDEAQAERTVSRLIPKRRIPPSQTWRTFLANHGRDLVSIDFFTVPTAGLRVLFVLVVLAHRRRRVVHFNITEHPTAHWTAQQIVDAFPNDTAPSYLLRDRDQVYGQQFQHRIKGMRIDEVLTTPQSPWQNPFVERLIGSVRRECLDHTVVLGERHLRRILTACRVEGWRGTPAPVSSPRPIERRGRFSRTPLSCRLRVKGYETYRRARFQARSQYSTR